MKIIGTTKDGFILQATAEETAHLKGLYSAWDGGVRELMAGTEFPVSDMYRHIYELSNRRDELRKFQSTLREVITLLEPPTVVKTVKAGA